MAHSEEWAIGYVGGWKGLEVRQRSWEKGGKRGPSHELVVHSAEWTTSWVGKHGKGRNRRESREPVDHFFEWTTGWAGKAGKAQEMG